MVLRVVTISLLRTTRLVARGKHSIQMARVVTISLMKTTRLVARRKHYI